MDKGVAVPRRRMEAQLLQGVGVRTAPKRPEEVNPTSGNSPAPLPHLARARVQARTLGAEYPPLPIGTWPVLAHDGHSSPAFQAAATREAGKEPLLLGGGRGGTHLNAGCARWCAVSSSLRRRRPSDRGTPHAASLPQRSGQSFPGAWRTARPPGLQVLLTGSSDQPNPSLSSPPLSRHPRCAAFRPRPPAPRCGGPSPELPGPRLLQQFPGSRHPWELGAALGSAPTPAILTFQPSAGGQGGGHCMLCPVLPLSLHSLPGTFHRLAGECLLLCRKGG